MIFISEAEVTPEHYQMWPKSKIIKKNKEFFKWENKNVILDFIILKKDFIRVDLLYNRVGESVNKARGWEN